MKCFGLISLALRRGCTTPEQISHLKAAIEDNVENLDGYEELDSASQDKVRTAIEVGHVSDDDWKGVRSLQSLSSYRKLLMVLQDLEMNRPGKRGFRVKRPKKAKEEKPEQVSRLVSFELLFTPVLSSRLQSRYHM